MPYHRRPDRIRNPMAILEAMQPYREAMTRAMSEVKPLGVHYHGLSLVIAAIDALATLLGYPEHHWSEGSAPRTQRYSRRSSIATTVDLGAGRL